MYTNNKMATTAREFEENKKELNDELQYLKSQYEKNPTTANNNKIIENCAAYEQVHTDWTTYKNASSQRIQDAKHNEIEKEKRNKNIDLAQMRNFATAVQSTSNRNHRE